MNSIVIIGLGLMGGSVAKALKNKNPDISISAFDHNNSALDLALDVGIIDPEDFYLRGNKSTYIR